MSTRPHDFSPISWRCVECGTFAGDLIASSFPCRPSTCDAPVEPMAEAEIDWLKLNSEFAT